MDRNLRVRVNILICTIILIGFVAVGITSYITYSNIINDDIVNISKLTSTNIYSEIRNELTKPIFVSLTMANDNFLKKWIEEEKVGTNPDDHLIDLQNYLLGIKDKYGYDSVFLISEFSGNYYHFNGINKSMSPHDTHDQWYYSFLESQLAYELDVDTDEANSDLLSVFVNCRIMDENGHLLGVTGVGLELNQIQSLLKSYKADFDLDAMLFSADGVVQVDSNTANIENENIFDINVLGHNKTQILNNQSALEVLKALDQPFEGYYITRYIEDLDWYLLIKKDTTVLETSLYSQLIRDVIIYAIVVSGVLLLTNRIIKLNDRALRKMAKTDLLTKLMNRRGFNDALETRINDTATQSSFYVFVFDIDNFKKLNDLHGHLIGDSILRAVGQVASDIFSNKGVISRWGGDEFAGYISSEKEEALAIIDCFFNRIQDDPEFKLYNTTVSMGVTLSHKIDTADTLIYRADKALYEAKGHGKNQYFMI